MAALCNLMFIFKIRHLYLKLLLQIIQCTVVNDYGIKLQEIKEVVDYLKLTLENEETEFVELDKNLVESIKIYF